MYNNYRIVVTTAAGRHRYMQLLVPYIVSSSIVDRYDIWVHTNNNSDIEFFKRLSEKYPVINLVWQPEKKLNGNATINSFYRTCVDEDTIYFKIDDDIVWMEPNLIEKMVKFRVENPQYFLVTPAVINNALTTYALQVEDKLKLDNYYRSSASHPVLWRDGMFALELHQWFITNYLKTGKWGNLHFGKKEMSMTRFSINAILWFGHDMALFDGVVEGDDEEFLSCILPTKMGKSNAWNGDVIAAHFAFFTQRDILDKAHVLDQYAVVCHLDWGKNQVMKKIDSDIQSIIDDIHKDEAFFSSLPKPYSVVPSYPPSKKARVLSALPSGLVKIMVKSKSFLKGKGWKVPVIKHIVR